MRCVWHLRRSRVSTQTNLNPVYMLCITSHFIWVFSTSHCPLFSLPSADCCDAEKGGETFCGRYEFEDAVFSVKRGDYSFLMDKVCQNLEKAKVWQHSTWKNTESMILLVVKWTAWPFEAWVKLLFFCPRLMQPMRTRRRCWRSISAVSPMVQWKPIKKGPVIGSKTKDLLWRGVWLIFNRPVAFYTKLTEQTLKYKSTSLYVLCQLRFDPGFV